jgi:hypothetical protein
MSGPFPVLETAGHAVPTLARWWCELNRGEWPEDFPFPRPPEPFARGVEWPHMAAISNAIGHKECLRAWNCVYLRMTHNEFEAWWSTRRFRTRRE